MKLASRTAEKCHCGALITGESLGQVASQTMAALACTDQAQDLPVLRPCIGMDKIEIINISRKIGTFETSIEPYEDCCTVFLPKHPTTKPKLERILESERKLDCEALIEAAIKAAARPAGIDRSFGCEEFPFMKDEAAENVEKIYIRMGDDELL